MDKIFSKHPRFCIIGSGYIFLKHVEAIRSIGGEITDVINEHSYLNWKSVIDLTKANYVVILTPNYMHEKMAEYASKKGKIVLVEKPFAIKPFKKDYKNVFVVLQLRYHPLVPEMRKVVQDSNRVVIDVGVWRDKAYDKGWKGNIKKSGGIDFNLGIHYLDLVYWLCGRKNIIVEVNLSTKCENPHRTIMINGRRFELSAKDNLSEENLHMFVYQDLIKGRGVKPIELKDLTNEIYNHRSGRNRKIAS